MIKSLVLKNFQSHLHSEIELSPGLNLITGSTDSGKSSIIRAATWFIKNKLKKGPKLYRSHLAEDSEPMSVAMTFTEGVKVERHSSPAKNAYIIHPKQELKAIRQDIPQEIVEIIKMNSINIEGQHEDYFLLEDTPGQVANKFNEVIELEEMQECMSEINVRVDNTKKEIKIIKRETVRISEEMEALDWLVPATEEMQFLDTLVVKQAALETNIPTVSALIESIEQKQKDLLLCSSVLTLEENLSKVECLKKKISVLELIITNVESAQIKLEGINAFLVIDDEYQRLRALNIKCKLLARKAGEIEKLILDIETANAKLSESNIFLQMETELFALEDLSVSLKDTEERIKNLTTLVKTIDFAEKSIKKLELEIETDEETLHSNLGKYETCPFCGYELADSRNGA